MSKLLNSLFLLVSIFLFSFCVEKKRLANNFHSLASLPVTQTVEERSIDLSKSVVKWRGTKLMGAGSHEGTVTFRMGKLLFSGKRLTGGEIIVDMKSIYITDIPLSDPVPRRNLTTHLNSDFNTDNFPVSSFIIKKVYYIDANQLEIAGELKIMSIARPVTIKATANNEHTEFKSDFEFNRFDWKIGENGSWLEKRLVDAEVKLSVELFLKGK